MSYKNKNTDSATELALKQDYEKLQGEIGRLKQELNGMYDFEKQQAQKLKEGQTLLDEQKSENIQLRNKCSHIQSQMTTAQRKIAVLSDDVIALKMRLQQERKILEDYESTLIKVEAENEVLYKERGVLQRELELQKEELTHPDNKGVQGALNELKQEIKVLNHAFQMSQVHMRLMIRQLIKKQQP